MLRIRRIADNCIHSQWLVDFWSFFMDRPVFFEGVCAASYDVLWDDTTHNKVHTSKVVGVFLQLLCIVFYLVCAMNVLADSFANSNKKWTWARSRVINFKWLLVFMVLCYNLRHNHGYLMWSIEFTCLFTCIGSKVTDEKFIHIAQYVIVLGSVCWDVLDEFDKSL